MTDTSTTPAPEVAPAPMSHEEAQAKQAADLETEGTEFLAELEKEAEARAHEWMSARVPERFRKMFNDLYPDPNAPPAPPQTQLPPPPPEQPPVEPPVEPPPV